MIRCPYCDFLLELKGVRPGQFMPACPRCRQKFGLAISGEGAEPVVMKLKTELREPVAQAVATESGTKASVAAHRVEPATRPSVMATSPPAPRAKVAEPTMASAVPDAAVAQASAPATEVAAPDTTGLPEPGRTLGGYELMQRIGHGGMGAVYLARQVSLDRSVAVKVLQPSLSQDPQFVARFTREAYAAAQLTHHNVVQIHDIGEEKTNHYFSMEFVDGKTLSQLVKEQGKLDPEAAVGYILQAARGLKFAHDHGLIHRDIKPDNLMINDQGIVKVADLGLVKRAGDEESLEGAPSQGAGGAGSTKLTAASAASATLAKLAMGTPAYMAPEQIQDASSVDHRADIYSLGCTLYDLLTGRPPFVGKTVMEVFTKHASEPVVPPDRIVKHVPPTLSAILLKMMAKKPDDRYQDMGEVIKELEDFLGVDSSGPFSPREEHVRVLEVAVETFNNSTWGKLRPKLVLGFFAACAVGVLAAAYLGRPLLAGGLVGLAVLSILGYQITAGIMNKTHLFTKFRQWIFGASIIDWLKFLAAVAILVGLLFVFDLLLAWGMAALGAAMVGAAFFFTIDQFAANDRRHPLQQSEAMLKQMRLKGLEENALRHFVCSYSGERWEEFYENLFGYEAKLFAREQWGKGERGKDRRKFSAWRDPVVRWMDQRIRQRKEARERRHLQRIEEKSLAAKGVEKAEAKKKARRVAENMVDHAAEVKEISAKRAAATMGPTPLTMNVDTVKITRGWDESRGAGSAAAAGGEEDEYKRQTWLQRKYGGVHGLIIGPQTRMILGVILLVPFIIWLYQNKSVPVADIASKSVGAVSSVHDELSGEAAYKEAEAKKQVEFTKPKKTLRLPFIPGHILELFSTYNAGLAGAILLLSAIFKINKLGAAIIPAAALIFVGHLLPIPEVQIPFLNKYQDSQMLHPLPMAAGGVLALLGFFFLRK